MFERVDAKSMRVIPVKLSRDEIELPEWAKSIQYLRYYEYAGPAEVSHEIVRRERAAANGSMADRAARS